jgi:hypothetical protein
MLKKTYIFLLFAFSFLEAQAQFISGKVFADTLVNCTFDNGEKGLKNWKIRVVRPGNDTVFTNSDAFGNYQIPVSSLGTYVLQAVAENHYWLPCKATKILTSLINTTENLGVQKVVDCSFLQVNVVAPTLVKGKLGNYFVSYKNQGTIDAQSAYVDITIDPFLTIMASSIPIQNIAINKYRFQLGTVTYGSGNTFSITTKLQNNISTGLSHCVEAHIFPDILCTPSPKYLAQIQAECNNSKANFYLKKIFSQGSNLISTIKIIEDDIVLKGTKDTLKNSVIDTIKPAFQTGYIYTTQVILPNGEVIGKSLQSCNVLDTKGLLLQYTQFNGNPFTHSVCGQNVGSIKAIEKTTLPTGRGTTHFIEQNEGLEYTIRFQNTMKDTAKSVIINDTLDFALDPTTLTMGASSHDYTWEISKKGELRIVFNNTALPDSAKNQLASQGYISYKIGQKINYPFSTVIKNKSSIKLGTQAIQTTNTVFHTIAKPIRYGKKTLTICENAPPPPLIETFSFPTFDSIVYVNLKVLPVKKIAQNVIICKGNSIKVGSSTYNSTGIYQNILQAKNGCDSIVTTNLTVLELKSSLSKIVCFGESVKLGNTTYSKSGVYTEIFKNKNDCDSVVTLTLKILDQPKIDTIYQVQCAAKGPFGVVYNKNIIKNKNGCDSTVIFSFTTLKADTITLKGSADKNGVFIYKNQIFVIKKDTIIYFDVAETINPCDFIKYTVKVQTTNTTGNLFLDAIKVSLSPNPFQKQTLLEVKNSPFWEHELLLFSTYGQLLRKEIFFGQTFLLEQKDLIPNVYFYKIIAEKNTLHKGKIIIY